MVKPVQNVVGGGNSGEACSERGGGGVTAVKPIQDVGGGGNSGEACSECGG